MRYTHDEMERMLDRLIDNMELITDILKKQEELNKVMKRRVLELEKIASKEEQDEKVI